MNNIHIDTDVPLQQITVDAGIPLPAKTCNRSTQWKYPFPKMKMGDSFFIKPMTTKIMSPSITKAKKLLKRNFTQRTVGNGVRVWRIP